MKPTLPTLLSLNAGFVDTALPGAAWSVHVARHRQLRDLRRRDGSRHHRRRGKLLALPVFCLFVFLTRLFGDGLRRRERSVLAPVLSIKLALLLAAAAMAAYFGPFPDGDFWPALATGMSLVAAMAIQNAVHRVHLSDAPPSTVMTMTTTQIMIDIADIFSGATDATAAARACRSRMSVSVAAFVIGCATAAALGAFDGMWCFRRRPGACPGAIHASAQRSAAKVRVSLEPNDKMCIEPADEARMTASILSSRAGSHLSRGACAGSTRRLWERRKVRVGGAATPSIPRRGPPSAIRKT